MRYIAFVTDTVIKPTVQGFHRILRVQAGAVQTAGGKRKGKWSARSLLRETTSW